MNQFRKQMPAPPAGTPCYHVKTHGGLGDILWLYKKLHNADRPIFLSISEENRHRPRRSGILADHLPRVAGWRFDDTTFAPGGQDWTTPDDPSCAIGVTWAEIQPPPNSPTPLRLECNRWLEGGRRLEAWLPDLATTHHFAFDPTDAPGIKLPAEYVIFHLAGWADVPDRSWSALAQLFANVCRVYVVGGTYDRRPRGVMSAISRHPGVDAVLLEDLAWPDLYALLRGCSYCFGHASGFTALADVVGCRGVIVNPRVVPNLTGTWNDTANTGLLYVDTADEFNAAVMAAARSFAGPPGTWPPTATRGSRIVCAARGPEAPVVAAVETIEPRTIIVAADGPHPDWLAAAVLAGSYATGRPVDAVDTIGCGVDAVARLMAESLRSSRRPVLAHYAAHADYPSRSVACDLAVVYAAGTPAGAYRLASDAWRRLGRRGTLMVGGPAADPAASAIGASLKVEPIPVLGAPDWYYIHKRN